MPEKVTKTSVIETAYGKPVSPAINFSYEYDMLKKGDEVPADEQPDADDIRMIANQKRNAAARAKAQQKALDDAGIEKPTEKDSPELRFKNMVKLLVLSGKTQAEAEAVAKELVGTGEQASE